VLTYLFDVLKADPFHQLEATLPHCPFTPSEHGTITMVNIRKSQLPLSDGVQDSMSRKSRRPDYKTIFFVSLFWWATTIPFWLATPTPPPQPQQNLILAEVAKPNVPSGDETPPSFTEILIESGSDKYKRHHYERYYEKWLPDFRHKPKMKILEIGAEAGKSLKVWSDYFSHPEKVLGLAYGTATEGVEERSSKLKAVSVYRGDQSKKETMDYLISQGPWDIIIDDGSHVPAHMIFSLFSLWNSIKPGGLYIIEDLETNYWPDGTTVFDYEMKGQGIDSTPNYSTVAKIQQVQQVIIARRAIGAAELSVMPGDQEICSIEWGMNCVAIRKCSEKEAEAYPPLRKKPRYDFDRMRKWIAEAKNTNPVV
jgi:hypothetical protein